MADFLRWWLAAEAVGLAALPLAVAAFRPLADRGIAFAKPLGLLLIGYAVWVLASGPVPNGPWTVAGAVLALAAVSAAVIVLSCGSIAGELRDRAGYLLAVEAVFLVALAGAAFLRSYVPEIHGTEKPMDVAFLNATVRAGHFPPPDPWLAGHSVSYYYFGYLIVGTLTSLTGLPTAVGFNLGLALVFALAAVAAVGLGYNLAAPRPGLGRARSFVAPVLVGLGAAALLLVVGSLEGVLEWLAARGYGTAGFWEGLGIPGLDGSHRTAAWYPTEFWWWWRATRVVPGTIHEFPFFSFLLGDLHPHVMSVPFVLLAAGVSLALWRGPAEATVRGVLAAPGRYALAALVLGGLAFLNTWDFPAAALLLGAALLARNLRHRWSPGAALQALAVAGGIAVAAVALYVPFYLSFSSQADGFGLVTGGATAPFYAVLHWGPLLLPAAGLAAYGLWTARWPEADRPWMVAAAVGVASAPLGAWLLFTVANGDAGAAVAARGQSWVTDFALMALLAALVLAALGHLKEREQESAPGLPFALVLAATGVLLALGPEFFYVRDVFGSRMNTVFKLWYHAWVLLSAAGAYGVYLLVSASRAFDPSRRFVAHVWAAGAVVVLGAALVYPVTATFARTDGFAGPRTLDGMAYLRAANPDEAAAIAWLDGLPGTPVVLEAAGNDWGDTGRVSALTGLPTVIGWRGHELQWRGSDDAFRGRDGDVRLVYETADRAEAAGILAAYDVEYVYVGTVERREYPAAGLAKFDGWLDQAFRSGDVVIYRVPEGLVDGSGG